MSNNDTYQDIKQKKQQANLNLEEAKAMQEVGEKQNQELANYTESRDLANQLHGRLVTCVGATDIFRAATLKTLREIRDNQLFMHIPVVDKSGNISRPRNFSEYCKRVLRRSHSPIYEQLQNLEAFDDAIDALKDMGVERDDFRLLRKQSVDLLEEVKQAAINNDKDKVLEIIDDLSSKHSKEREKLIQEKESLQTQLEKAKETQEANERFLQQKDEHINRLDKALNKCLTPDEEKQRITQIEKELKQELEGVVASCAISMDQLNVIMTKIFMFDQGSEELQAQPRNQFEYLIKHLVNVGTENQLLFDAENIFAPLMLMFDGAVQDKPNS